MKPPFPQFIFTAVAASVLLAAGCAKKTEPVAAAPKSATLDVVKESERSRNFVAVSKHLELGGTLYGYVDIDGDVMKLLGGMQGILGQVAKAQPAVAPFVNQDLGAIATMLGLTDVKAVGLSSVPDGTGFFRNRVFLYTGGERHGLLASLGGKPGPFTHLKLAPADAAFYAESEIDLPVAYKAIKEVIAKVGGEAAGNQFENGLKKAGENAALSVLDLIYGLKGHSSIVVRLDAKQAIPLPTPVPVTLPGIALLISIDGVAPMVEASLAKVPALRRTDRGAMHVYAMAQQLPWEALQPVIIAEGNTLHLATTPAFFDECHDQKTGLAQDAAFQRALATVGAEGNGLTYVSPKLFEQIDQIAKLNSKLPADTKSIVDLVVGRLPHVTRPMVSVRTNEADGILVKSYWDRSLKQEIVAGSLYNPVSVGLLAAMAIPAFQKVRTASQEKAVLNNLRMLAAAADQYYLENGARTTTLNDLVGPTHYVRTLQPVAGEDYRQLRFQFGVPLRLTLPDGRVIQYPADEQGPVPPNRRGKQ